MTLSVNVYVRTPDGRVDILPVDHADELAGFESCRHELWGHQTVRALGLRLLPTLVEGDIWAEGSAIDHLESDTERLLAHVTVVANATGYSGDFISSRCRNILGAIRRARKAGGGVVIS